MKFLSLKVHDEIELRQLRPEDADRIYELAGVIGMHEINRGIGHELLDLIIYGMLARDWPRRVNGG